MLLQIIKIPGTVNFKVTQQAAFRTYTDIEKTVFTYRRKADIHLPAMHFPADIHTDGSQFFFCNIIIPLHSQLPLWSKV